MDRKEWIEMKNEKINKKDFRDSILIDYSKGFFGSSEVYMEPMFYREINNFDEESLTSEEIHTSIVLEHPNICERMFYDVEKKLSKYGIDNYLESIRDDEENYLIRNEEAKDIIFDFVEPVKNFLEENESKVSTNGLQMDPKRGIRKGSKKAETREEANYLLKNDFVIRDYDVFSELSYELFAGESYNLEEKEAFFKVFCSMPKKHMKDPRLDDYAFNASVMTYLKSKPEIREDLYDIISLVHEGTVDRLKEAGKNIYSENIYKGYE